MPAARLFSHRCTRWMLISVLLFALLFAPPAVSIANAPTLDDGLGFDPFTDDSVYRIAVQPDGMILVAGPFTTLNGLAHSGIGRLYPDGRVDPTFNAQVSSTVRALLVQPDGKIVIGGDFHSINGQPHSHLARLNADGSLDESFTTGTDDLVFSLLWQPENKILVGGRFALLGESGYPGLGRLNLDGSLDESFQPLPFDADFMLIRAITRQPDGKLLVGGSFTKTESEIQTHTNIARLSADGALDETFNAQTDYQMHSILMQGEKILIGGMFFNVNDQPHEGIARLNASGSLDDTFTATASGYVFGLLEQPDGKILINGSIGTVNELTRYGIARLNADGSLDVDFDPHSSCPADTNGRSVYGVALQDNGKILVGGEFNTFGCQPRNNLARLFPDGALDYVHAKIYLPMISQK